MNPKEFLFPLPPYLVDDASEKERGRTLANNLDKHTVNNNSCFQKELPRIFCHCFCLFVCFFTSLLIFTYSFIFHKFRLLLSSLPRCFHVVVAEIVNATSFLHFSLSSHYNLSPWCFLYYFY